MCLDYLRETEDMLSYEPFLGVADPPSEHSSSGIDFYEILSIFGINSNQCNENPC